MKSTIELAKEADFHVFGDRVFSPYAGGTSLNSLLENLVSLVRVEYEAPLKLAEEALDMARKGVKPGAGTYGEALATIRAAREHAHGGVS